MFGEVRSALLAKTNSFPDINHSIVFVGRVVTLSYYNLHVLFIAYIYIYIYIYEIWKMTTPSLKPIHLK